MYNNKSYGNAEINFYVRLIDLKRLIKLPLLYVGCRIG